MRSARGFTLIELLITIAVLGILSAITVSYTSKHQKTARDAQRKSDLNQLRMLLENFANNNGGLYKSRNVSQLSTVLCSDVGVTTGCPVDPINDSTYRYRFITNGTGNGNIDATDYHLWARLQLPSSPATYFVYCQNGKSGPVTTEPTALSCPPL